MRVLFVCTGNTCRSCMAEAIFNSLSGDCIHASSAGVAIVRNSKTSKNAVQLLRSYLGVDFKERYAVQLTAEALMDADYVFTMTSGIKSLLTQSYSELSKKIYTINEFVGVDGDVIDPYGGDISVYDKTFSILTNRIKLLLDKLKKI